MKTKIALINLLLMITMMSFSQTNQKPCSSPEHRQFDFWIGEWEVFNPQGILVGTNIIKPIEKGCGLQENWSGSKGTTGTSYNYYDPQSRQWNQLWLDSKGGILDLKGTFKNGSMVLQSEEKYNTQNKVYFIDRITWTPNDDGNVRQHWERSNDKGKNWKTIFDGLYKKVQEIEE